MFSKAMKSEILATFGNRVKMLREQNGLSQEEFAYNLVWIEVIFLELKMEEEIYL